MKILCSSLWELNEVIGVLGSFVMNVGAVRRIGL